jgi:rsbT co-antagonist protein RsbR
MTTAAATLTRVLEEDSDDILDLWVQEQLSTTTRRRDLIDDAELRRQSRMFLSAFDRGLRGGELEDINASSWDDARAVLREISRKRVELGFSPSETATFVFSLKQTLLGRNGGGGLDFDRDFFWHLSRLLDRLGLYTTELYQQDREGIIRRQQQEILELSTPVVKLWEGIVTVPLVGTLDSARTQVVMETLLETIVATGASVAIIDITGVPTVDTLVAQHLIKTVGAARLMGATCMISGIRPQIAQTIVHLGISLDDVATKATLADAMLLAMNQLGYQVTRTRTA